MNRSRQVVAVQVPAGMGEPWSRPPSWSRPLRCSSATVQVAGRLGGCGVCPGCGNLVTQAVVAQAGGCAEQG